MNNTQLQKQNKKIKPIKIPSKQQQPTLLLHSKKQEIQISKQLQGNKIKSKVIPTNNNKEDKKLKTNQTICAQLLKQGHIQSFIDMFYIAHKTLPNIMQNKNYFGQTITTQSSNYQLNQSDILFLNQLSNNLKKAQSFSYYNQKQKQKAINAYHSLAYTYQDQTQFKTAAYFYNKVIQLSRMDNNKQYEVIGLIGIGKCYDQQKQTQKAIQIFEQSLKQADNIQSIIQRQNIIKLISKDLIEIYLKIALQFQKQNNNQNALLYFQKCLSVAKKAKQIDSQALISYKIGQLYYNQQKYSKSVEYQNKYLNLIQVRIQQSKNTNNDDGKQKNQTNLKIKTMEAHAALSKCYLKLKSIHQAQKHLTQYNQIAKQFKIQNSLAHSSYYLAKLYEQKGNKTKSIQFYKAYFQAAKSQKPQKKERQLVDKARVTYAIAKGNQNMGKFIKLLGGEHSLKQILDWKIKKELR